MIVSAVGLPLGYQREAPVPEQALHSRSREVPADAASNARSAGPATPRRAAPDVQTIAWLNGLISAVVADLNAPHIVTHPADFLPDAHRKAVGEKRREPS